MPAKEFVGEAARRLPASARVINLCRDLSYLSLGYYCSLLAEARGQKVIPSVEVMLDLHWKRLLRIALPEVNELLRRTFQASPEEQPPFSATIFFGVPDDPRLAIAARRIFELFGARCSPSSSSTRGAGRSSPSSRSPSARCARSSGDLRGGARPLYASGLADAEDGAAARWSIAILHDPKEKLPPSNAKALERFVRAGAQLGCDVDLITRADYGRLAEFDALFIRETTALDHHTYRFARKAESEGMPVIDDPRSILKCTNKIYLAELLQANNVPCPRTLILDRRRIGRIERELGFPAVIKIPDGSFSRGVFKAMNAAEWRHRRARLQGHRPDHRPGVHGDVVRLAGRRARPQAALRLQVLHGARPLADRQAWRRRERGGGRFAHVRPRRGAAEGARGRRRGRRA